MGKIFKALEKSQVDKTETDQEISVSENGSDANKEIDSAADGKIVYNVSDETQSISEPDSIQDGIMEGDSPVGSQPEKVPETINSSIITELKPHSLESEQFRILKTTILFPDKGEPPRSIMITSSAPSEGKSFVASNLAVSLAKSIDEYVLLIDCDLRRPTIHSIFGFPPNIEGLSEHLSRDVPISSLLRKTAIDKLTILPCGTPPANPAELVSSTQMSQLINEVKSRYEDRYIIIDSPPPNLTSETNALARQVDGIIIVVRNGKTKIKDVQDLIDTYGRDKILGVVKNFAPIQKAKGYYKNGYVYNS